MKDKVKVIIDSDYGTYYDDAFALLYAVQNDDLDILAVNSSYADTKLRARIAKKLLRVSGREEIPVYAGIPGSMSGGDYMFGFEGENILTDEDLQDPTLEPEKISADDAIIEIVKKYPGEVTIITTGTVTNVAAAVIKAPEIVDLVKEVIIMGGVIVPIKDEKGVMRSPVEEYNLNNDTYAAQVVWDSGLNITLVPIDVTLRVPLEEEQIERIKSSNSPVAKQVAAIIDVWPKQEYIIYTSVGIPTEFTGLWLHDPLTIGVARDRSFITEARFHVDLEFAQTVVLRDMLIRDDILRTIPKKKAPNMNVAIDVDHERFTEDFTTAICK